jgi:hypothetical protein
MRKIATKRVSLQTLESNGFIRKLLTPKHLHTANGPEKGSKKRGAPQIIQSK